MNYRNEAPVVYTSIMEHWVIVGGGEEPLSRGYGRRLMFEGHVFESQHHILDGHFLHLFVVKIVLFVSKDRKSTKKKPGIAIF